MVVTTPGGDCFETISADGAGAIKQPLALSSHSCICELKIEPSLFQRSIVIICWRTSNKE
jgi:hypothetical protein